MLSYIKNYLLSLLSKLRSAKAQLGQHPKPSPQGDRSPAAMEMPILADRTTISRAPWRRERSAPQFGQHLARPGDLDRAPRRSSSDFKALPRPRISFQS